MLPMTSLKACLPSLTLIWPAKWRLQRVTWHSHPAHKMVKSSKAKWIFSFVCPLFLCLHLSPNSEHPPPSRCEKHQSCPGWAYCPDLLPFRHKSCWHQRCSQKLHQRSQNGVLSLFVYFFFLIFLQMHSWCGCDLPYYWACDVTVINLCRLWPLWWNASVMWSCCVTSWWPAGRGMCLFTCCLTALTSTSSSTCGRS